MTNNNQNNNNISSRMLKAAQKTCFQLLTIAQYLLAIGSIASAIQGVDGKVNEKLTIKEIEKMTFQDCIENAKFCGQNESKGGYNITNFLCDMIIGPAGLCEKKFG